jgi:hypothetical protein
MQYYICYLIVALCMGYAAWRTYKALTATGSSCHSGGNACQDCSGCQLKEMVEKGQKQCCTEKNI